MTAKHRTAPLSTEDHVWFNQLPSSNICIPLIIKQGTISIECFRTTIRQMIECYEILRTNIYFNEKNNHFEQKVLPFVEVTDNLFQLTHTKQKHENIDILLAKDYNRVFQCHLIKESEKDAEYLYPDDVIVFIFDRLVFNLISLQSFLHILSQTYDQPMNSSSKIEINKAHDSCMIMMDGYDYDDNSLLNKYRIKSKSYCHLRHCTEFTLDSKLVNAQIQFASSNNLTLFQLNLACFFIFLYKLRNDTNSDLICALCSTDDIKATTGIFKHIAPYRVQILSDETLVDFTRQIQRLCMDITEYDPVDNDFCLFNIPIYFEYGSNMSRTMKEEKFELKTKEATLKIHFNQKSLLSDNDDFLSNLSLIMNSDDESYTINCKLTGFDDDHTYGSILTMSQKFQRFLSQLFSNNETNQFSKTLEPINKLSLLSLDQSVKLEKTVIQRRLSILDADLPSAVTITSSKDKTCRKWLGVIWLIIELNLVSSNIYGFSALFKILPKYGIYDDYCIEVNVNNSTELDCSHQMKQYQNALTLGLIFFNIPSIFTGILIDKYGTRFTRLIGIIFYIIGWFALALIKPGRDGFLFVHTLFTSLSGKMIQMSGYATANYFSKSRAYVLTVLVGCSSASPIWYSLFQVLINKQILTLYQLSYIWMSFSILLVFSSFFFLDWKFSVLNLPYKFDTHLEKHSFPTDITVNKPKWYENIYHRRGVWEHLTSRLYILLVLFISILMMPNVFISVTWYPWVYYITDRSITKADNYTLAYNLSTVFMLALCPITGFLLGFHAEKSKKRKCLNISIVQTIAWLLNIISCFIYMSLSSAAIVSAIIFSLISRATLISSSQAAIATFFPSVYVGRLTGIMWTVVGMTICLQYGLIKLTDTVPDSWRAWVIILVMSTVMFCHIVYLWITYIRIAKQK